MKTRTLPNGSTYCTMLDGSRRCTGSMMGRPNLIPADASTVTKLHLIKLRFVDGDYDEGGAYWGAGLPIYWAYGDEVEAFFRARNRPDAKRQAFTLFPNAKFYR